MRISVGQLKRIVNEAMDLNGLRALSLGDQAAADRAFKAADQKAANEKLLEKIALGDYISDFPYLAQEIAKIFDPGAYSRDDGRIVFLFFNASLAGQTKLELVKSRLEETDRFLSRVLKP